MLVVEVLAEHSIDKDLSRNPPLFLRVKSLAEYWVIDGVLDPERPSLKVYRRNGDAWRSLEVPAGESYTTNLLPGFRLRLTNVFPKR